MMAQTEVDTGMALLLSVEAMIHYPAVQMFPVRRATLLVKLVIITTMSPFDDCMKFTKSPKSLRVYRLGGGIMITIIVRAQYGG
jgi:hypothetical protein